MDSPPHLWKSKMPKIARFLIIFLLVAGWVFAGWPAILSFAQEATSTASSSPELATSTPIFPSSSSTTEPGASEPTQEELQDEVIQSPEPSQPPLPPLKVHKLEKQILLDKNARHECQVKNFKVDISNRNSATVEFGLKGKGDGFENIEIGSLPSGIDITFLHNADYEWRPQKSENTSVLQITNQPGSQKGNFSVPIIYTSGNSTTMCQINVINF